MCHQNHKFLFFCNILREASSSYRLLAGLVVKAISSFLKIGEENIFISMTRAKLFLLQRPHWRSTFHRVFHSPLWWRGRKIKQTININFPFESFPIKERRETTDGRWCYFGGRWKRNKSQLPPALREVTSTKFWSWKDVKILRLKMRKLSAKCNEVLLKFKHKVLSINFFSWVQKVFEKNLQCVNKTKFIFQSIFKLEK